MYSVRKFRFHIHNTGPTINTDRVNRRNAPNDRCCQFGNILIAFIHRKYYRWFVVEIEINFFARLIINISVDRREGTGVALFKTVKRPWRTLLHESKFVPKRLKSCRISIICFYNADVIITLSSV